MPQNAIPFYHRAQELKVYLMYKILGLGIRFLICRQVGFSTCLSAPQTLVLFVNALCNITCFGKFFFIIIIIIMAI
jgi:hypothetical protein